MIFVSLFSSQLLLRSARLESIKRFSFNSCLIRAQHLTALCHFTKVLCQQQQSLMMMRNLFQASENIFICKEETFEETNQRNNKQSRVVNFTSLPLLCELKRLIVVLKINCFSSKFAAQTKSKDIQHNKSQNTTVCLSFSSHQHCINKLSSRK